MTDADIDSTKINLQNFIESTHGHMDVLFFGPDDVLNIISGNVRSVELLQCSRAIGQWLNLMSSRRKKDRFLCIGCETSFGPEEPPAGFAVILPFANRDAACVSGICDKCASDGHEGRAAAVLRGLRRLMPDCQAVDTRGSA